MGSLNNAQLEILKMFDTEQSDEELAALRQVLSEYLATRLIKDVEQESLQRGYTTETVDTWKEENNKTPYK